MESPPCLSAFFVKFVQRGVVGLAWQQLQVFGSIIERVAVTMVDDFFGSEIATYQCFHDKPVQFYSANGAGAWMIWSVCLVSVFGFLQTAMPVIMFVSARRTLLHGDRKVAPVNAPLYEAIDEGAMRHAEYLGGFFDGVLSRGAQFKYAILVEINAIVSAAWHKIASLKRRPPQVSGLLSGQHAVNLWGPCKEKPPYALSCPDNGIITRVTA